MLDGDDGVSRFGESVDKVEQMLDVFLVEPAGGFVEKEKRVGCLGTGKRDGKAEPGAFTAGEVGCGLPEFQVVKTRIDQWF